MTPSTFKLNPSVHLKSNDLEQRLEKKLNDVKSFNNSTNNNKEMITYFRDRKNTYQRRNRKTIKLLPQN